MSVFSEQGHSRGTLALQTWAGVATLDRSLFIVPHLSLSVGDVYMCCPLVGDVYMCCPLVRVPAALVGARHKVWLLAVFRPNLIH